MRAPECGPFTRHKLARKKSPKINLENKEANVNSSSLCASKASHSPNCLFLDLFPRPYLDPLYPFINFHLLKVDKLFFIYMKVFGLDKPMQCFASPHASCIKIYPS